MPDDSPENDSTAPTIHRPSMMWQRLYVPLTCIVLIISSLITYRLSVNRMAVIEDVRVAMIDLEIDDWDRLKSQLSNRTTGLLPPRPYARPELMRASLNFDPSTGLRLDVTFDPETKRIESWILLYYFSEFVDIETGDGAIGVHSGLGASIQILLLSLAGIAWFVVGMQPPSRLRLSSLRISGGVAFIAAAYESWAVLHFFFTYSTFS